MEYEFERLTLSRELSRNAVTRLLTDRAEHGGWELHRVRISGDGTRRVVKVAEVQGMEGSSIVTQDLFAFEQTGFQNGRVIGALKPTGLRPKFADKFAVHGIELPANLFSATEG